jgi:[calcium/calmodulin-dependent protein kinase] kinase
MRAYQHGYSDPNTHEKHFGIPEFDRRPMISYRVMQMKRKSPPPRMYDLSNANAESSWAQEHLIRRQVREAEELAHRENTVSPKTTSPITPCPSSPDDELVMENLQSPSRVDTSGTMAASASASTAAIYTPLTSPSAVASPISINNPPRQQSFRSDPSLPALLSGASSVSADAEGDFLLKPGSLHQASLLDTTDSLTPPAMAKEPMEGFPMTVDEYQTLVPSRTPREVNTSALVTPSAVEDDEDSDSDEGLTMANSRRRALAKEHANSLIIQRTTNSKRRDTQTSIGSTETAKKVVIDIHR